jgi:hypothetical protein
MTSTGTVSCNTVNIYAVGSSTEAMVCGGVVYCSDSAESNIVNIHKNFSCNLVFGWYGSKGHFKF